jgi:hypothetical protein
VTPRAARRLAWSLFAVSVVSFAAALTVVFSGVGTDTDYAIVVVFGIFMLAFGTVGALVASRRPGNPLGWIMCLAALAYGLMGLADRYAQPTIEDPGSGLPGGMFALWASSWGWIAGVGPAATFLLLLFPTGRLPSRRWRPVAWLAAGGLALCLPGLAFTPGRFEGYDVENPVGVPGADIAAAVGLFALVVAAILSIASLLVRYRNARPEERQQLKWLMYAGALVGLAIASLPAIDLAFGPPSDNLSNSIMTGSLAAIPVAIGIAILRHGLYDVDVVINRTLVYGALTATLLATYLGSVLLLQLALSPLTEKSDLAIAGSTLAVAALFRPARRRIQSAVDRRFYRRRYDAARTLERFGARLRDEVDLDALAVELRGVVADTMQPAHVSLWIRAPRNASRTPGA